MFKKDFFIKGIKDGIPIALAYFAVSFSLGMMAKNYGISILEITVMSLTNLTSAGEFASLSIIGGSGSYLELVISQFVINLRYSLMSISLSQKFDLDEPILYRAFAAYGVTDEIFAISSSQENKISAFYNIGAMAICIPGWTIGTFLGALLGNILPSNIVSALSIALYGMFIAIIIPPSKNEKAVLILVILAMLCSSAFYYLPFLNKISSGFSIIIVTILVSLFGAFIFPKEVKDD